MGLYDLLSIVVVFLGIPAVLLLLIYNAKCAEVSEIREARADLRDALPWADTSKLILDPAFEPIIVQRKKKRGVKRG